MIRGIAFDLDGTLLDHDGAELGALSKLYPTLLASDSGPRRWLAFPDFAAAWHDAAERGWQLYVQGDLSFAEQRTWRVQQVMALHDESGAVGQPLTEQEVSDIFDRYLTLYEDSWVLYPDVLSCLEALAAYPLGLITNGDSDQQRQKLDRTGIAGYISIPWSCRVTWGWQSPSGRYLSAAPRSWACNPMNCSSSVTTPKMTCKGLCMPVGRQSG